jgi:hypothetical protein
VGANAGAAGAGANGGAAGAGANGGAAGAGANGGSNVIGVDAGNACTNQSSSVTLGSLDMLIVQDKTGSMDDATASGPSKWAVITDALTTFVQDPQSAGIGAGIEFFGGDSGEACNVSSYANPEVPIAPLNGNAPAIVGAIQGTNVGGHTPTPAALQGAIEYTRQWAADHLTHKVGCIAPARVLRRQRRGARGAAMRRG